MGGMREPDGGPGPALPRGRGLGRTYQTVDLHVAGEPLRIVTSGVPPIPGRTMLERRAWFREHLDHVRTTLMLEPRGHADMYGCVITPPASEDADMGVLFMHNEGYSSMCGHGIVGLVTAAVPGGLVADPARIVIDTPSGPVEARAAIEGGSVVEVAFRNVPSFVLERGLEAAGLKVDVAFGGAFYAVVDPSPVPLEASRLAELRVLGMRIKRAVEEARDIVHPLEAGLPGIYGTIFRGPASGQPGVRRNVTVFAEAAIDRSPCGTGTSAVMALEVAAGRLAPGEAFLHESLVGTRFTGRTVGETRVGTSPAIIPEIAGTGYVTGYQTFVVDPADPLGEGFRL